MCKRTRNTIIGDLYYDLDLANAHPAILRNICDAYGDILPHKFLTQYCDNRSQSLAEVASYCGVSSKDAKELFLRLCNFGSFRTWCQENQVEYKDPSEVQGFLKELEAICDVLREYNTALWETTRNRQKNDSK